MAAPVAAFFNALYFIAYTVLLIPCGNGAAFNQLRRKNKMEYQEYIKSNPETLDKLAENFKSFYVNDREYTGVDISKAAQDIRALSQKGTNLQNQITNLEQQLKAAQSYQEKLSDVFEPLVANLFNSKIDEFITGKLANEIDLAIDDSSTISDAVNEIDDLKSQLDGFEIDGDQIAETVRDMIRDGDITVSLDVG
jgi:flagellar biosynthesis chaperone FliJ